MVSSITDFALARPNVKQKIEYCICFYSVQFNHMHVFKGWCHHQGSIWSVASPSLEGYGGSIPSADIE